MDNPKDEIKQRLDIVDLLSEYIKLTPSGSNFKARCPFHNEKTPSFMVSPEKQIWHCFGCSKGGDIFSFIQNLEGVEFPEALRILAQRAGVKLTYQHPEEHNQRTRLLDLLRSAGEYWHQFLIKAPEAEITRQYLIGRQVKSETINDFQLGYAKDSWDDAIKYLQNKGYSLKEIGDAGLSIIGNKGNPYDRFRARLIFPIRDVHGNIVGFTARKMKEDDAGGKYINSPQTSIYNKSHILYNLDLAKQEVKRLDYAILVEGNMDALMAYQSGTKNVMAISGTALTEEQIKLLKRYTINVMIAFDADVAGVNANLRGIDLAWQAGLNVKVIHLAGAKDPDELIKKDVNLWRQQIKSAENFMDYVFAVTLKPLNLARVDHKKQAAKKLLAVISKLGDSVEQAHYLKKLAGILNVAEEALAKTLLQQQKSSVQPVGTIQSKTIDAEKLVAERLLSVIINFPNLIAESIKILPLAMVKPEQPASLYKEIINQYNENHLLDPNKIINLLPIGLQDYFNQISLLTDLDELKIGQTALLELNHLAGRLKEFYLKGRIKELEAAIKQAEINKQSAVAGSLSEELAQVLKMLNQLA